MCFLKPFVKSQRVPVTSGIKATSEEGNRREVVGQRVIVGREGAKAFPRGVRRMRDSRLQMQVGRYTAGKYGGFKAVISARLSSWGVVKVHEARLQGRPLYQIPIYVIIPST